MNRTRYTFLALTLVALSACSDSKDDKSVGGRTRSLSKVAPSQTDTVASLQVVEERAQTTQVTTSNFTFRVNAVASAAPILRLPDGTEEPFVQQLDGTWQVERPLPSSGAAGAYTAMWIEADGSVRSLALVSDGVFPDYPVIDAPLDMALVPAGSLLVQWTHDRPIGPFEVTLSDEASGAVVASQVVQNDLEATLAGLTSGRYRLRVAASTAAASAQVRATRSTTILVDVQ